ncbi:MAG: alkene reductase [Chloroflexi bacterium]|nr:alkene reductase [Chloroflexota bacterium]MCI0581061.1 alkene reductase [Chloroflexota bacterium]MCI0650137.1 alkene reductase [Chloroflexota bacterium]MCI0730876.1 alkene reductase [Chloroflexota bacterium]
MNEITPAPTYQSYILRLWRDSPVANWRAMLEDVHSQQQLSFASIELLVTFLLERTLAEPDEHPLEQRVQSTSASE